MYQILYRSISIEDTWQLNSCSFKKEKSLRKNGFGYIAGVDEVGRGALAGPIVAAAVVFDPFVLRGKMKEITDSKKLTAKKREALGSYIKEKAVDYAIGKVQVGEIERYGIGAANILAFKRALDGLKKVDFALIDGRKFRGLPYEFLCIEKGDNKSVSIAAASILAKVHRDNIMTELHKENGKFFFDSNKGYGEKKHYDAIIKLGPSKHHRQNFLGEILRRRDTLFK